MTFLATAMNIFSVVANISNNINNNNNNNNQVSYNAQSNNNVVTNTNVNNGNQVNVMVPVLAPWNSEKYLEEEKKTCTHIIAF